MLMSHLHTIISSNDDAYPYGNRGDEELIVTFGQTIQLTLSLAPEIE